jgi:hypothetical protein
MIPEAHTQHMQWYQQLVWSLAEIEHRIYVESYPEMDEQSRSSRIRSTLKSPCKMHRLSGMALKPAAAWQTDKNQLTVF